MTQITDASPEAGASVPSPPRDDLFRADFNADLELRDNTDGPPTLFGHFARFNKWTEIDSVREGHFMERIAPGAFTKTFAENRANMKVLFQHGHDVLGQQVLGTITDLREDDQGAYYEVPLFDGIPPLIVSGLRGRAYGSSFRFKSMREDFNKHVARSAYNPTGLPERTVLEAKVPEFGPVTFPAYSGATAGLRSLTDEFLLKSYVDHPDRLMALIAALRADQHEDETDDNRAEPEPPEATTQTPEKPERPVATTPLANGRPTVDLITMRKEAPTWRL